MGFHCTPLIDLESKSNSVFLCDLLLDSDSSSSEDGDGLVKDSSNGTYILPPADYEIDKKFEMVSQKKAFWLNLDLFIAGNYCKYVLPPQ